MAAPPAVVVWLVALLWACAGCGAVTPAEVAALQAMGVATASPVGADECTSPPYTDPHLTIDCGRSPADGGVHVRGIIAVGAASNFTLSPAINALVHLTVLDVHQVAVEGHALPSLANATQLTTLYVTESSVSGAIPHTIAALPAVARVNLGQRLPVRGAQRFLGAPDQRRNFLTGHLPVFVSAAITELQLVGNSFEGGIPAEYAAYPHLRLLALSNNQLSGPVPSLLWGHPSITHLYLEGNLLTGGIPNDRVAQAQSLEVLWAAVNRFHGDFPAALFHLPNVTEIMLNDAGSLPGTFPDLCVAAPRLRGACVGRLGLTGTLPHCPLPLLESLCVHANNLTGGLPDALAASTSLEMLLVSDTALGGELPPFLGHMSQLKWLAASNSRFTGSLPPTFFTAWPFLGIFDVQSNSLTGALPVVPSPHAVSPMYALLEFRVSNNRLSGGVDFGAWNVPTLQRLVVDNNNLTGSLASLCAAGLGHLFFLDVSHNGFTDLPPCMAAALPALTVLNAGHNAIAGTVPPDFAAMSSLSSLVLSHNALSGEVSDALWPLRQLPLLQSVDVSHNAGLLGALNEPLFVTDLGKPPSWPRLTSLLLSSCSVSGGLPLLMTLVGQLAVLDVSHNTLSGALPPRLDLLPLQLVQLQGNQLRSPDAASLPPFVQVTATLVSHAGGGHFACPALTLQPSGGVLVLDPAYYGATLCRCDAGYYGANGVCEECVPGAVCPAGTTVPVIPPGWFPLPSAEQPVALTACPTISLGTTPCNPDGLPAFTCAQGHAGYLCSQCVPGWASDGRGCVRCGSPALVLSGLLLAGWLVFVYARSLLVPSSGCGVTKTAVWWVQLVSVLPQFVPPPASTESSVRLFAWFNLQLGGLECVSNSLSGVLAGIVIIVCLPAISLLCTVLLYAAGRAKFAWRRRRRMRRLAADQCADDASGTTADATATPNGPPTLLPLHPLALHRVRSTDSQPGGSVADGNSSPRSRGLVAACSWHSDSPASLPRHRRAKRPASVSSDGGASTTASVDADAAAAAAWLVSCKRSFMYILLLAYLPLTTQVLLVFPCDTDELGHRYMRAAPHVACDSDTRRNVVAVASVGLACFVVGTPVFFFAVVRHYWHRRMSPGVHRLIGFLYGCYKPHMHAYAVVAVVRKVLVAALAALLDPGLLARMLLAALLLALLLLQLVLQPFKRPRENVLHSLADSSALLILLFLSFAQHGSPTAASRVGVVITVITVAMAAVFTAFMVVKRCERLPAAAALASRFGPSSRRRAKFRRCCCCYVGIEHDVDGDGKAGGGGGGIGGGGSSRRLRRPSILVAFGQATPPPSPAASATPLLPLSSAAYEHHVNGAGHLASPLTRWRQNPMVLSCRGVAAARARTTAPPPTSSPLRVETKAAPLADDRQ